MRALRLVVALVATALVVFTSGPALARDIRVAPDQAFPIRLAEPAEGVAIGNPAIAAVTVQNDRFLFVTGRTYGSTNLVVVGEGGRVLYSGRVVVTPDETDVVMVTRGVETARLECTPTCRARPEALAGN
ncbi:pilus assembly protein N-terminal domain-containing protein [Vitreimonas sp.]|jgi:Flp pilus assembly secretin CpaC|uniref:pilus assembly protein N-terminal domain-containing protein n=1 Tax=Vitreimonas sp. TaxID=3069702 RepID=UPI002ED9F313